MSTAFASASFEPFRVFSVSFRCVAAERSVARSRQILSSISSAAGAKQSYVLHAVQAKRLRERERERERVSEKKGAEENAGGGIPLASSKKR